MTSNNLQRIFYLRFSNISTIAFSSTSSSINKYFNLVSVDDEPLFVLQVGDVVVDEDAVEVEGKGRK